jgi:hypothetical protein
MRCCVTGRVVPAFQRTVVPSSLQGQLFLEDEGTLAL